MSIRHYLFVIAVAAVVTALLTPLVRAWSIRRGLVDEPDARKVHEYAISRLGGIAM
ncbi:MAG: undecaprenyl-phosphate alpha-N-acetylglucosaminyl 1-phosphate transferase, partial [Actinobacteria bacterium HGW-Actinobacteria-9]